MNEYTGDFWGSRSSAWKIEADLTALGMHAIQIATGIACEIRLGDFVVIRISTHGNIKSLSQPGIEGAIRRGAPSSISTPSERAKST